MNGSDFVYQRIDFPSYGVGKLGMFFLGRQGTVQVQQKGKLQRLRVIRLSRFSIAGGVSVTALTFFFCWGLLRPVE